MVVTGHPEDTAERLRPAVSLLGVHLTAGGRRWLLDLLPDGTGADAPEDRAAGLTTVLDDAAGDPARTVAGHGVTGVATLRAGAAPGDVVLTVGSPATTATVGLRLRAWGVSHVTLPTGPTSATGPTSPVAAHPAADVVLPPAHDLREAAETLAALGSALAATPARPGPAPTGERGEVCITCADEAVVAEVVDVLGPSEALVRIPDETVLVDTTLVDDLQVHDLVLVHARTAITQLDADRR